MSLFKCVIRNSVGHINMLGLRNARGSLFLRTLAGWALNDVHAGVYAAGLVSGRRLVERPQVACDVCSYHIRQYGKKAKDSSGKKENATTKKGHRGPEKPNVQLTFEELNEVINFDKLRQQMDLTLDHMKKDYVDQLSLRTSAAVFDSLTVETPDGQFSLIEIAQVVLIVLFNLLQIFLICASYFYCLLMSFRFASERIFETSEDTVHNFCATGADWLVLFDF
jgi:hypothetical protein